VCKRAHREDRGCLRIEPDGAQLRLIEASAADDVAKKVCTCHVQALAHHKDHVSTNLDLYWQLTNRTQLTLRFTCSHCPKRTQLALRISRAAVNSAPISSHSHEACGPQCITLT
jgi:hypothetical protein